MLNQAYRHSKRLASRGSVLPLFGRGGDRMGQQKSSYPRAEGGEGPTTRFNKRRIRGRTHVHSQRCQRNCGRVEHEGKSLARTQSSALTGDLRGAQPQRLNVNLRFLVSRPVCRHASSELCRLQTQASKKRPSASSSCFSSPFLPAC